MKEKEKFQEFEKILYANSNNKIMPGLERIKKLLERLDNPQNSFKSVHIVGTNGKGSTGAFISSILKEAGYKTGFYLSPHLESPGERFLVNGEILSADCWINAAEAVVKVIKADEELPSYFELVTACAFWLARENKIEIGVIEAGLGGQFDATNVMDETVCTVITSISMDHMEYLGPLLENIAAEKFAVVKKNVYACFAGVDASLIQMFKDYCTQRGARPCVLTEDVEIKNILISPDGNHFDFFSKSLELKNIETNLIGNFQIYNAALSLLAISKIKNLFKNINEFSIRNGLKNAAWPARLEIISRRDKRVKKTLIILDGAHNFDGIKNLCESVKTLWPDLNFAVVYAAMRDKNYLGCLALISNELKPKFYPTTVPGMPRALPPDELANAALGLSENEKIANFAWRNPAHEIRGFDDPVEAVRAATADDNDAVMICGSLYLAGFIRNKLKKEFS